MLVELRLGEGERQAAGVDRHVELPQDERQGAEVVLVAVRDDEAEHVVAALEQVADVGQHEVDAEHVVAREREPAVDDDDLAAVLHGGHVLADLAEAAERDDADGVVVHAAQHSEVAQGAGHHGALVVAGGDERQAQPADVVAEQVERRLHRDGVGGDEERLVEGT